MFKIWISLKAVVYFQPRQIPKNTQFVWETLRSDKNTVFAEGWESLFWAEWCWLITIEKRWAIYTIYKFCIKFIKRNKKEKSLKCSNYFTKPIKASTLWWNFRISFFVRKIKNQIFSWDFEAAVAINYTAGNRIYCSWPSTFNKAL